MSVDIAGGFSRPVQDENWLNKVLIGGVVNIVPVVNLMAVGYNLRYLAGLLEDEQAQLPEWGDWGELFMLGLKMFAVACGYFLGVILLGVLSVLMLGVTGAIITGALYLFVMFLFPVAVLRFVQEGFSVRAAFAVNEIYQLAVSRMSDYFIVYLVLLVASLVIGGISSIPVVGWIVGMLASFYLMLASSVLLVAVFGGTESEV